MQTDSAAVVVETGPAPDACVIWLHGLGADGHDFEPVVAELNLPASLAVRFLFPHAPMMAVTINNGYVMRAWYDILAMDIGSAQDEAGIRRSQAAVEAMIRQQVDAGIRSERIVLAGFSQGGAIILQTGLRCDLPLAGLLALSTYLPLADSLEREQADANRHVPIFYGHGSQDPVVPLALADLSSTRLRQQGYALEWREYPGLQHGVNLDEIGDISRWLQRVL